MEFPGNISVILLAGGRSSRMGSDKRLKYIETKPLIVHSISLADALSDDVIISSNDYLDYFGSHRVVFDNEKWGGPLAALDSCLEKTKNETILILTCDMPFLSKSLLAYMIEHHREGSLGCFIKNDDPYPFPMIISGKLTSKIKEQVATGKRSMKSIIENLPFNPIDFPAWASINTMKNINSPEDLSE